MSRNVSDRTHELTPAWWKQLQIRATMLSRMEERSDQQKDILEPRNSVVTANQKRAAAYVRMSTEHQRYSIRHQMNAIEAYADTHGIEIVQIYEDSGKSGLSLKGRHGLLNLLSDVIDGSDKFGVILVQDISRWGRFQDADEAAYYEYLCKRAGYQIHYCMEQFDNDDSPVSAIMKSIKRAMAGEYSRELSRKVFASQCTLAELGYRQSGVAGYGLRRMMVDEAGNHKLQMENGEHKSIRGYRVILVKGPASEVRVVRGIFSDFVNKGNNESAIAEKLNSRGILNSWGRPWNFGTVQRLLTSEKYIGINVFNQTSFKLRKRRVKNPPCDWVRKEDVFEPLVDKKIFEAAQKIILARYNRRTTEELVSDLRALLQKHGYLSQNLIDNSDEAASTFTYRDRFGSLLRAYALVGYSPTGQFRFLEYMERIRLIRRQKSAELLGGLEAAGANVRADQRSGLYRINSEFDVALVVAPCIPAKSGKPRWQVEFRFDERPEFVVLVTLDPGNQAAFGHYVLPARIFARNSLFLRHENRMAVDAFRVNDLNVFYDVVSQCAVRKVVQKARSRGTVDIEVAELRDPQPKIRRKSRIGLHSPDRTYGALEVLKAYRRQTQKLRALVETASNTGRRVDHIAQSLGKLLDDEHFVTLLRAEKLETIPTVLAEKIIQTERVQ